MKLYFLAISFLSCLRDSLQTCRCAKIHDVPHSPHYLAYNLFCANGSLYNGLWFYTNKYESAYLFYDKLNVSWKVGDTLGTKTPFLVSFDNASNPEDTNQWLIRSPSGNTFNVDQTINVTCWYSSVSSSASPSIKYAYFAILPVVVLLSTICWIREIKCHREGGCLRCEVPRDRYCRCHGDVCSLTMSCCYGLSLCLRCACIRSRSCRHPAPPTCPGGSCCESPNDRQPYRPCRDLCRRVRHYCRGIGKRCRTRLGSCPQRFRACICSCPQRCRKLCRRDDSELDRLGEAAPEQVASATPSVVRVGGNISVISGCGGAVGLPTRQLGLTSMPYSAPPSYHDVIITPPANIELPPPAYKDVFAPREDNIV